MKNLPSPQMRDFLANTTIGAIGVVGSLTLPELAGTLAGFGTFLWMMVQCYIAIQRAKRGECSKINCPNRIDPAKI